MRYKYGDISSAQLGAQKKYFKDAIYQLLCFKEESFPTTDQRFLSLQQQLDGFNRIYQGQTVVVTVMSLLEAARNETNHTLYRKAMLDAIGMIDLIEGGDSDV